MAKNKLSTPAWVLEGYDSPEEYEKARGKTTKTKKKRLSKLGSALNVVLLMWWLL